MRPRSRSVHNFGTGGQSNGGQSTGVILFLKVQYDLKSRTRILKLKKKICTQISGRIRESSDEQLPRESEARIEARVDDTEAQSGLPFHDNQGPAPQVEPER